MACTTVDITFLLISNTKHKRTAYIYECYPIQILPSQRLDRTIDAFTRLDEDNVIIR